MVRIIFYRGRGNWIDWLIRTWTNSAYSHCELVFSNKQCFSSDAWSDGVRYKNFLPTPYAWVGADIPLTERQEVVMRAWCDSQIGKKYDYLAILFGSIFKFGGNDPARWTCSEICTAALQRIGYLPQVDASKETPKTLAARFGFR